MRNWSSLRVSSILLVAVALAAPAAAWDPTDVIQAPAATRDGKGFQRKAPRPERYWTAARMRAAKPRDVVRTDGNEFGVRTPVPGRLGAQPMGDPVLALSGGPGARGGDVPAGAKLDQLLAEAQALGGIEKTLGVTPFNYSRYRLFPEPSRDPDTMYRTFPYSLTGKLFFSIGESDFVCSASSVNSANLSVVWTAGHCVVSPTANGPLWHTNFLFVPGYRGQASCGTTPFGCWTAKTVFSLAPWGLDGLFEYDHGALVMNLGGNGAPRRVGQRIGFLGFVANIAQDQHWHAHGYPQAAPFDGNHHEICTAQLALVDSPTGIPGVDPETSGIGCDQTGGSSGGPWVINFSGLGGATNLLNGNNSYRYGGGPPNSERMFGPYFTNGAVALRNAAQGVPVP